jgi:branched-chain amino acid transport system substrate-binding protein
VKRARYLKLAAATALAPVLDPVQGFAQAGPPLKIGLVASFSGANTTIGRLTQAAVDAYMRRNGDTIAGRKVQVIKRDDTGPNPEIARRLAQELIVQDRVDILIGAVYTPTAIAMASVSTAAKKPFFNINAATSGIFAKNPYSARFGFTTAQITTPFAKWAITQGVKTSYAVYQDYGPGIDAGAAWEKTFVAAGGQMLGEARIPLANPDFSAFIQRIKDAKPDAAFIFLNATGGGADFLRGCKTAGIDKAGIKLFATGDIVDEPIVNVAGDAALGMITTFIYSSTHKSALNRQFVADVQAVLGTKDLPNFDACQTYDVMHAVYTVAKAQNGNIDPDRTMEIVKGMHFESPRGPILIDPATRDIVQNVYLRRTDRVDGLLRNVEFSQIPMVHDPNET